jgi:1-deoxy-D-xylulose-5-phosphate synthase
MISDFPRSRPNTPALDKIAGPADLKTCSVTELNQLADELRQFLLFTVGQTGGHLGASLGVVELTLALHQLLDTPNDQLIWDVGHQAYPHKILTGRREQMLAMRMANGLTPFPTMSESEFDSFGTGHSSTSISAALGLALANQLQGLKRKSVAVIGDGALTAGMAFEALNHAAHTGANLLVILNDNDMSISPNQGGLATYLATQLRERVPTNPVMPLFEALNFNYAGPIDGHDFDQLLPVLNSALNSDGPQFLHVRTQKGKGFAPAEEDPVGYHAITKLEHPAEPTTQKVKYSDNFGQWLTEKGHNDNRVVAITPAMREGSGLVSFANEFPDRYFDVAIAEQHAATLAAGFAVGKMKPVLAIYSTFLQRAYDQVVHDLVLQNLDCLVAIDRAGLVGEDGPTHSGIFDIAFLRTLPGAVVMTPSTLAEQSAMLELGYQHSGPAFIRYPRGSGVHSTGHDECEELTLGKGAILKEGHRGAAILNFGPLLERANAVADALDLTLVDMRFVKPIDTELLTELASRHTHLFTLEDHAVQGGAGSAVAEWISESGVDLKLRCFGVPDKWIAHGTRDEQLRAAGLDKETLQEKISHHLS